MVLADMTQAASVLSMAVDSDSSCHLTTGQQKQESPGHRSGQVLASQAARHLHAYRSISPQVDSQRDSPRGESRSWPTPLVSAGNSLGSLGERPGLCFHSTLSIPFSGK